MSSVSGLSFSGLASGTDTDAMVEAMLSSYKEKYDNETKEKLLMELKMDKYREVNTNIMKFYDDTLAPLRLQSTFTTGETKASDPNALDILSGGSDGDTIEILQLATQSNLKTSQINSNITKDTKLSDLGLDRKDALEFVKRDIYEDYTDEEYAALEKQKFEFKDYETIGDLTDALKDAGFDISFDEETQSFDMSKIDMKEYGINELDGNFKTDADGNIITEPSLDEWGDPAVDEDGNIIEVPVYEYTKAEPGEILDKLGIKGVYDDNGTAGAANKGDDLAYYTGSTLSKGKVTGETTLESLGVSGVLELTINDKKSVINLDQLETLDDLAEMLEEKGLDAKFDDAAGALQIKTNGDNVSFEAFSTKTNADGSTTRVPNEDTLEKLGIQNPTNKAQKAIAIYNGMEITSDSNTFELDGITFTAKEVTTSKEDYAAGKANAVTLSKEIDEEALFDTIKGFVDSYNTLIGELNTLVGADYNKDYQPLTSEEKEGMSEEDIKLWDEKIEESLLRKDPAIEELLGSMRNTLMDIYPEGEFKSLADIGITTSTAYTEKGKLYLDEDKLKNAISENPEGIQKLFNGSFEDGSKGYADEMYDNITSMMKSTAGSSAYFLFDDKDLQKQIDDQDEAIAEAKERMEAREEIYEAKFLAMEMQIQKLNSQASMFSGTTA